MLEFESGSVPHKPEIRVFVNEADHVAVAQLAAEGRSAGLSLLRRSRTTRWRSAGPGMNDVSKKPLRRALANVPQNSATPAASRPGRQTAAVTASQINDESEPEQFAVAADVASGRRRSTKGDPAGWQRTARRGTAR